MRLSKNNLTSWRTPIRHLLSLSTTGDSVIDLDLTSILALAQLLQQHRLHESEANLFSR